MSASNNWSYNCLLKNVWSFFLLEENIKVVALTSETDTFVYAESSIKNKF